MMCAFCFLRNGTIRKKKFDLYELNSVQSFRWAAYRVLLLLHICFVPSLFALSHGFWVVLFVSFPSVVVVAADVNNWTWQWHTFISISTGLCCAVTLRLNRYTKISQFFHSTACVCACILVIFELNLTHNQTHEQFNFESVKRNWILIASALTMFRIFGLWDRDRLKNSTVEINIRFD